MRQHFGALVQVSDAGLRDSSERVRGQALAAVATLVQWVAEEPEVKAFCTLLPSILQARCPAASVPVTAPSGTVLLGMTGWMQMNPVMSLAFLLQERTPVVYIVPHRCTCHAMSRIRYQTPRKHPL